MSTETNMNEAREISISNQIMQEKAKAFDKIYKLYDDVSIFDEDGSDSRTFTRNVCDVLCEVDDFVKKIGGTI